MHIEVGRGAEDAVTQGSAILRIGIGGLELERRCIGLTSQRLTAGMIRGAYKAAGGHPYRSQKRTPIHHLYRSRGDHVLCHSLLLVRKSPPHNWRLVCPLSSLTSPPRLAPTRRGGTLTM